MRINRMSIFMIARISYAIFNIVQYNIGYIYIAERETEKKGF